MGREEFVNGVSICAKYLRKFGPVDGLTMFVQARILASACGTTAVHVPGAPSRVILRGGTSDVDVFEQIFVHCDYDARYLPQWRALEAKYDDTLRRAKCPIIVDCGANMGMASIYFHSIFPRAAIVAIEPEPGNFGLLQRNSSSFPRITPVHAAVSDRAGMMRVANPGAANWAFQFERADGAEETAVPAITVFDALNLVDNGEPLIVKVDIEGAEEQLFRAPEWAARVPLVIVELHDWMKPWAGSSHPFLRAIGAGRFDLAVQARNVFAFSWDALHEFATEAAAQ